LAIGEHLQSSQPGALRIDSRVYSLSSTEMNARAKKICDTIMMLVAIDFGFRKLLTWPGGGGENGMVVGSGPGGKPPSGPDAAARLANRHKILKVLVIIVQPAIHVYVSRVPRTPTKNPGNLRDVYITCQVARDTGEETFD
jgi:hypothetical protein